jgi:hypothetical protein
MSTADILHAALSLSPEQRGEIAHQLILSLDREPSDDDVDRAWASEINRRRQAIREGRTTLRDWDEALTAMRQSIAS